MSVGIARDHRHGNEAIPAALTLDSLTLTGDLTVDDITADDVVADTLTVDGGLSAMPVKVGGVLDTQEAAVGTDANTTEKTLWTKTILGSTLGTTGDELELVFYADTNANANIKTLRIKFGATTVSTLAAAMNATVISTRVRVVRISSTSQHVAVDQLYSVFPGGIEAYPAPVVTTSETLANDITFSITGQNGTASANDIEIRLVRLMWWPGV
jgi:hypothetical protein